MLAILTAANTWPSVILYEDKDGEWIIVERGWPFRYQTHLQEFPFGTAQEAFAKGWPSGFDVPLITNASKLAANSLTAIVIAFGTLMATQFLSRHIARRIHHLRSVPFVQSLPVLGLRWQVLPTTLISAIALPGIAIGAIHLLSSAREWTDWMLTNWSVPPLYSAPSSELIESGLLLAASSLLLISAKNCWTTNWRFAIYSIATAFCLATILWIYLGPYHEWRDFVR